jgi:hypothetical protein
MYIMPGAPQADGYLMNSRRKLTWSAYFQIQTTRVSTVGVRACHAAQKESPSKIKRNGREWPNERSLREDYSSMLKND